MAFEEKKYVPIDLDRPRRLRLTWNALCSFSREMGKPFDFYFSKASAAARVDPVSGEIQVNRIECMSAIPPDVLRTMLWAALLHEDKTLTQERVGDLIEEVPGDGAFGQYDYVLKKVREAWEATLPEGLKKIATEAAAIKGAGNGTSPAGMTSENSSSLPPSTESVSTSSGR
jgi:ribosomal protein S9